MKIHDFEQGTPEWSEARKSIPTASNFGKIVTATGKASSSASTYMNECLAEWMGAETEQFETEWMIRGRELEPEARKFFEFDQDLEVSQVGFVTTDDGMIGCSPDGLIYKNDKLVSGLEIKCPKASTHIGYMLKGGLPDTYKQQVYGSMWVTGCKEWFFMSYHPELPPFITKVEWDSQYITLLSGFVEAFVRNMQSSRQMLVNQSKAA